MKQWTEDDFTASVGKYGPGGRPCYNTTRDQQIVQDLLNRIPEEYGGASGKLRSTPRWGAVSVELQHAIERFQAAHAQDEGLIRDGHIDPHQRTIRALLKFAYHRVYGWGDDRPLQERIDQTRPLDWGLPGWHNPDKSLPTSGVKATDKWEFKDHNDYRGRYLDLDNGVLTPSTPPGRERVAESADYD